MGVVGRAEEVRRVEDGRYAHLQGLPHPFTCLKDKYNVTMCHTQPLAVSGLNIEVGTVGGCKMI